MIFLAMAAYLGVHIWRSARTALQTSPAVLTTVTESASMTGLAVRQELVVSSDRTYVFVSADDGSEVARGAVLASAMDSESALQRAGRKKELQTEIARLETLLSGLTSSSDPAEKDAAARKAVLALNAAVYGSDRQDLYGSSAALSSLVLAGSADAGTEEQLAAMKDELAAMEGSTYTDSEEVTAPESGLFSTLLDGWEAVGPDDLSDLTPSGLRALFNAQETAPAGAIGKIVTDWRWYFAAVMASDDAARLTVGDYVTVSLGRHYGGSVSMRVESVSAPQNGERAVVLSTLKALSDTIAMRRADAEMIYSEQTGLRVPTKALHVSEDGRDFVYVVEGGLVAVKYVETVCQTGDYFLVADSGGADDLRAGDEIIVRGRSVSEGMIVG